MIILMNGCKLWWVASVFLWKKLFLGSRWFSPEGMEGGAERILILFLWQKLPTVQKLGGTLYIFQTVLCGMVCFY